MSLTSTTSTTIHHVRTVVGLVELPVPGEFSAGDVLIVPFVRAKMLSPELSLLKLYGNRVAAFFHSGVDIDLPMRVEWPSSVRPFRGDRRHIDLSVWVSKATDVIVPRVLPQYPLVIKAGKNGDGVEMVVHEDDEGAWLQMVLDFSRREILQLFGAYHRGMRKIEERRKAA